jgi:hypothetical protein
MTAAIFNLDNFSGGNFAIEQGATFNWLTIAHPSNLSAWIPRCQIRDNYLHLGGNLLAEFMFDHPLVYGEIEFNGNVGHRTIVRPILTDEQTSDLPLTVRRKPFDRVVVGRNAWVYDLKLESPTGEVIIILKGYVQVVPDVTEVS